MSLALWIQLKVGQSEQEGEGREKQEEAGLTYIQLCDLKGVCVRVAAGCSMKETTQPHQVVG